MTGESNSICNPAKKPVNYFEVLFWLYEKRREINAAILAIEKVNYVTTNQ